MQPCPIYFLTLRKCGIFGLNCESLKTLSNEAGDFEKRGISQLHHFFEHYGMGEMEVFPIELEK